METANFLMKSLLLSKNFVCSLCTSLIYDFFQKLAKNLKAMQSRFAELQRQNSSIGRVKVLMAALQDENQMLDYLDLEEKKRAIDEKIND